MLRCIYDKSENQIIILKENYECLMWKISFTEINPLNNLNPFQLFKQHYLKAINEYLQKNDSEKISKLNRINLEIIEAWNCSDIQVREAYEILCYSLQYFDVTKIKTINNSNERIINIFEIPILRLFFIFLFFIIIVISFAKTSLDSSSKYINNLLKDEVNKYSLFSISFQLRDN